jgi:hypothetical protein
MGEWVVVRGGVIGDTRNEYIEGLVSTDQQRSLRLSYFHIQRVRQETMTEKDRKTDTDGRQNHIVELSNEFCCIAMTSRKENRGACVLSGKSIHET